MLFLYDPINNVKKETNYNLLEGITGIKKETLASMKSKKRKIKNINSFLIDENTSNDTLYEFMCKEKPKNEIWKAIEDTNEIYEVSNYGRIRRKYKSRDHRLLRPYRKKEKWLTIKISGKEIEVHKLVANAFLEVEEGKCIYHKDENICNNHADNLGFITRHELGLKFAFKSHGVPVLKIDSINGEILDSYENMAEAGRENFIHRETIRQAVRGLLKTAGGYVWKLDTDFMKTRGI